MGHRLWQNVTTALGRAFPLDAQGWRENTETVLEDGIGKTSSDRKDFRLSDY